ncbi:MAG: IS4 family transposase [Proteobacteria bacterium]|nr:IS4 family transposase [Pseudomonadota bacterium]
MTPNISLLKSNQLREFLRIDYLKSLWSVFPFEVIDNYDKKGTRDRVYSIENTIMAMVYSATMADKTLENAVDICKQIHNKQKERILKNAKDALEEEKAKDLTETKIRRGPKKKYKLKLPKSKISEISENTAAYSKARKRVSLELMEQLFYKTRESMDSKTLWYGMETYLTDGTYVQMQDTKELREIYDVKSTNVDYKEAYPQGLVQSIIQQGSGIIHDYALANRHVSELSLIYKLIDSIPPKSLLLADDLYNTYAVFSLVRKKDFDIIVPGKRLRNYKVIKQIADGDEIVEIKRGAHPDWLPKNEILPDVILLRRLTFLSLDGTETMVLYTTLLDEKIPKSEIILKYFTRWDIEITIREIKTIMDINVLRGKTDDIIKKELISAFIAYNLIRKIIAQSTEGTAFSPERDIIQEFFESNKELYIDRKNRVYKRWSPGRYGKTERKNTKEDHTSKTRKTIP